MLLNMHETMNMHETGKRMHGPLLNARCYDNDKKNFDLDNKCLKLMHGKNFAFEHKGM